MAELDIKEALSANISAAPFATMERLRPDIMEDPYSFFERQRASHGDVIHVENGQIDGVKIPFLKSRDPARPVYVAMGFEAVRRIVGDQKSFHQDFGDHLDVLMGKTQLAGLNPPNHAKYRALITKAFEMHSLDRLQREFIDPLVDGMLDQMEGRDSVDLVQALACRLPVLLIMHICALPFDRCDAFASAAARLMANMFDWQIAVAASEELKIMFDEAIERRRAEPADDLISKLILSEIAGERLSHDDLISTCRALIPAGIETTVRGLGSLMAAMITHPEQMDMVRRNPGLGAMAVEELLRWNGPAQILPKRPLEDVELAGTRIPANSHLWVYIGHANRDPRHWEKPELFDITRRKQPHLAFSFGAHFCVGNQFARRELNTVFHKMLERFPNMRPDPGAPLPVVKGFAFRSPDRVDAVMNG